MKHLCTPKLTPFLRSTR